MLINLGGLNGFLVTGDLFNMFVFMEIFSVSAYALVAMAREPIAALAALKYLLLGALSSLLVLFSVGVVFAMTGALNIEDAAAAGRLQPMPAGLALAGLATGFAVKAALFPVHFWLPDAHAAAPAPVSAHLSALVVKAGVVGMLRTLELFAGAESLLQPLLTVMVWLGALGTLGGALMALVQRDIKLMLAYSTMANIGYIFIGLGLATTSAVDGAMVHAVNHAVMKSALFLAAGAMIHRTGLRNIDDLRGTRPAHAGHCLRHGVHPGRAFRRAADGRLRGQMADRARCAGGRSTCAGRCAGACRAGRAGVRCSDDQRPVLSPAGARFDGSRPPKRRCRCGCRC